MSDIRPALQQLADAAGRYLYDAPEASPEVRQELRERLAEVEEQARDVVIPLAPTEWQLRSVGFLANGDIYGDELHHWRIKLGERTEACAFRLTTERRSGGWPTIAGAPNGLPLFVRRTDEACDCARLGVSPETGV